MLPNEQGGRPPEAFSARFGVAGAARTATLRGAGFGQPLAEDDEPAAATNPLDPWVPERDALVLLVGDGKVFVLPPAGLGIIVPPARLRTIDWSRVALEHDLGPLLGLPPVGAGASRVFKAGPRLGVMLDAGRHPQRQPAAVYLDHVVARAHDLGVTEVRALILIHRHADHANEMASVVRQYGIAPQNVIVPRAFMAQQPDATFNATMRALRQIFGASWQPADLRLRPATPGGELVRGRYTLGDTSFEFLADSAALRLRRHTDAASLLVRVTRRGDLNASVVIGDPRGADLERFHALMGAQAWREFFRNVETIDGFSHHRGALVPGDVNGIMRLLEATLLRTGRLTVTLQTDPGQHAQARGDTLEFMRRIGLEVREAHVARTTQPSGVTGSMRGATASGSAARSHAPIPSALTEANARIGRLAGAREMVILWGPHVRQYNPSYDQTAELRQIDRSLDQLRGAAREAILAAANVRASGTRTTSGERDYAGGAAGTAYAAALGRIPAATPAETAIGPTGFARIEQMRRVPASQVPLRVALNDALLNGRYSRQAFRYMISQLDPATRESIFRGPRGGTRGRLAVFERVRAQFGFQQALSGGMSVMSAGHLRGGPRAVARGVAGVLAVVEIGNLVAQGVQSYRVSHTTARRRHVAPFLRRVAFWRQLRAEPAAVAVDDGLTGQDYERDPQRIDAGLRSDRWDFLYIEHTAVRPALADAGILQAMMVLGHNVRNYDEYATLFVDSGQDAIRFVTGGRAWAQSRWEVRVGRFETSGTNRVEERWQELPPLTEGMNALARRLIENTTTLLQRAARGQETDTQELGTLQLPRGRLLYRARLRPGITSTLVELRPTVPPQWSGRSSIPQPTIQRRVVWQTNTRPEFFVWEQDRVEVRVSGADWPTYYRFRDLPTEEYSVGSQGTMLNALQRRIAGNELGEGWILTNELERI